MCAEFLQHSIPRALSLSSARKHMEESVCWEERGKLARVSGRMGAGATKVKDVLRRTRECSTWR